LNSNSNSIPAPTFSSTTTSTLPSTAVSASLTRLQAAVAARRQQQQRSNPATITPAELEKLWEEDHAILLSAVEALVQKSSKAETSSSSSPLTPSADDRSKGQRSMPRPFSSGPTPPPPPPPAAAKEESDEKDLLTRPVALWLRKHEPLLKQAAAAAAEARTFDVEAALLSLCARENISPQRLAEECAALRVVSSSSSENGEEDTENPLGVDVAAAFDRAAELRRALATFEEDLRGDAPGFVTAADEETLRVRYRHVKGTKEHTVRFEATIMAPLEHLLALCSEIDLSPGWNRFVVDAAVVARTAKFCSFYYASQWSPRPFPQMDSCVRVRGHDAYDSSAQGAVVCLESWPREGKEEESDRTSEEKEVFLDLPAAAAKRHRVSVMPGSCIVLAPIRPCPITGAKRTRGYLLVTLDPHLPFVPSFLVAWVLRVLAPAIKRGIDAVMASWFLEVDKNSSTRAEFKAAGGEMAAEMRRRLKSRPELYELAQRLVERHAQERGGVLPASPERRSIQANSAGSLRRSSSEIPAAGLLRRRSSQSSLPASVSAVVDGAIARLSRLSSGGGGGVGGGGEAAAMTTTTTTTTIGQASPPSSSEEDQGWISWLSRPLSATASYASSLLFTEQQQQQRQAS